MTENWKLQTMSGTKVTSSLHTNSVHHTSKAGTTNERSLQY